MRVEGTLFMQQREHFSKVLCLSDVRILTMTKEPSKFNILTSEEERIILHKGTEMPYTGELLNNKQKGTYVCRQCETPLFTSDAKFNSNCGWPSFDEEINENVMRIPDKDGRRTEIVCSNCAGHLGHVFLGEGFTVKNTRHCVNSISMKFISFSTY